MRELSSAKPLEKSTKKMSKVVSFCCTEIDLYSNMKRVNVFKNTVVIFVPTKGLEEEETI